MTRRMRSGQGPTRGGRAGGSRPATPDPRRQRGRPGSTPGAARTDAPGTSRERGSGTVDGGRPGGVRRAAGAARRTKAPRLPQRISGRAAALGLLLVGLTLAYAYPVRVYLAQQAEIDQLESAQTQQRDRIADLRARIARWDDPNFVITQARARLQLVRKGELIFVVQADQPPAGAAEQAAHDSWLDQLWSNVQGADNPDGP